MARLDLGVVLVGAAPGKHSSSFYLVAYEDNAKSYTQARLQNLTCATGPLYCTSMNR
jgi:hypothetical protein